MGAGRAAQRSPGALLCPPPGDDSRDEVPLAGWAIGRARYRNSMNSSRDGGRNADAGWKGLARDPLAPIEPPVGSNHGASHYINTKKMYLYSSCTGCTEGESLPAYRCKPPSYLPDRPLAIAPFSSEGIPIPINHIVHEWGQEGKSGRDKWRYPPLQPAIDASLD